MALSSGNDILLRQGHPIRVHWNGWETDTYRLHRFGWKMASHEDFKYDVMRVIFQHGDVVAEGTMSGMRHIHSSMRSSFHDGMRQIENSEIVIGRMMHVQNTVIMAQSEPYKSMVWRDMEPSDTVLSQRNYKLSELSLFRELAKPVAQELILSPDDVQATLDLILKAQAPGMKDIRARESRRERDDPDVKQVHAQIISFKQAA